MALVELVDTRLGAKGRKMRRNASHPDEAVQIQQVTCIRGGARKDWLVLPLMIINGRQCAAFSPLVPWLHQLLNGGCGRTNTNSVSASPHVGAITNFFKECLQQFKEFGRQQESPIRGCEPSRVCEPNKDCKANQKL